MYWLACAIKELAGDRTLELERNFLHAAHLEFTHPRTSEEVSAEAELPEELVSFVERLRE